MNILLFIQEKKIETQRLAGRLWLLPSLKKHHSDVLSQLLVKSSHLFTNILPDQ